MSVRKRWVGVALFAMVVATSSLAGVAGAATDDASTPSTTTMTTAPPTTTTTAPSPTTTTAPPDPATTVPDPDDPAATPEAAPAGAPPDITATPTVTVTPSTALAHLQTVTLAGTGFSPGIAVGWAECVHNGSGDPADCDTGNTGSTITDAAGAFSTQFTVHRFLHTANGDVDCASAPGACTLGAGTVAQPSTERASAVLEFDPDAPLPPPPSLTVDPVTELREGDTVDVAGSGYLPSSTVAIVQCSVPASPQSCQTLSLLPSDAAGSFATQVTVHRFVATPPFGATDCAAAPGTCQLQVVSLADYFDYAAHADLAFDPDGPLPPGEVTVTPDTGLVHFQTVSVAGSAFPHDSGVQIVQCTTAATSFADCSPGGTPAGTSGTGTFSAPVVVRRVLHLAGDDFDCASAPGACSLVSTSFGPTLTVVVHPISFDPNAPLPPPPSVAVVPDADLVHGQSVTVTGAGFAPGEPVRIGECLSGGTTPFCGPGGAIAIATADGAGAFEQTLTVSRGVLDLQGGFPPAVADCAASPGRCSVVATSFDGADVAEHAVDFDPSVPIPVPATTVSPQFDVPDRALVHVRSTGFSPGEHVVVSECVADAPIFSFCPSGVPGAITADATGAVDTWIRVRRELATSGLLLVGAAAAGTNCADAVGTCVVRVRSLDDLLVSSDVPLGFDPTAVAPPPVVTLDATGPYVDGQEVVVHGDAFTPLARLGIAQCAAGAEPGPTTCDSSDEARWGAYPVDRDGTITHTTTLRATVQTADHTIDCRVAGACVLFVANRDDFSGERVLVPLEFVAGATTLRALAFTGAGAATAPVAVVGLGLLLVGGALVLLTRRRLV